MKKLQTIKDITNIKGKRVLLRVDFNVPIKDETGEIQDNTRIKASLPTIKTLQDKGAKIIIISHLGRPGGEPKEEFRLTSIAKELEKLIKSPVKKIDEIFGAKAEKEISELSDGGILMLENIRFDKGEKQCDPVFTKKMANLGDIFVNDAFGAAHRKHASTAGLAEHLPAYAGLLMEKEIKALYPIVQGEYKKPLTTIFGGAKIDTKIDIIKSFIDKADYFLIGGGLANTFLHAAGYNIGESLCEKDKSEVAQEIMLKCEQYKHEFLLPNDVVVASEISTTAKAIDIPAEDVMGDMKILDIGKLTAEKYCEIIQKSKTIIWNGPLGVSEYPQFRNGSKKIAECIAKHEGISILGGGDTIECLKECGVSIDAFTHVSTGGGASLEFLAGKELPGIEPLMQ